MIRNSGAIGASPRRIRDHANTFVWMGDSRLSIQFNDGAKRNKSAAGFMNVANAQSGQRMVTLGNFAVAGHRSDQYVSSLAAAIALRPRFLVVLGAAHDIAQNRTAAEAWGDVKTIIDAATRAGIVVIGCTEPGSVSFSAAQRQERNDFNARLYEYARAMPGLLLFDYAAACLDPAATSAIAFRAGLSSDGTHLSNAGARVVGEAFASFLSPLLAAKPLGTPLDGLSFAGSGMVLRNGLFLTTSGGSTVSGIAGTSPAHWGMGRSGSPTATVSTGAAPDGVGNELIVAVSANAAGDRVQAVQQVAAGLALNDTVRGMAEISVDPGASNLRSVRAYVSARYDGFATTVERFDMQPVSAGGNTVDRAYTDLLAPDAMTLNGGTTLDRVDLTIAAEFSGPGSATFRVRKAQLLKNLL